MSSDLRRLVCAMFALLLLASCSGTGEQEAATETEAGAGAEMEAEAGAEAYAPEIDPARFTSFVNNPFYPLLPGMGFVYETPDGSERVEVTVTDRTKEIMGVACVVVENREYEDGVLTEETIDWFAQDADGNVWYFGEATREFAEDGTVSTAGSWEAGQDGAFPGVIMPGTPKVGEPFRQEYFPGHAEDMGEVVDLDGSATVPHGTFEGVLVIKEWNPLEPGASELNYYARGVGLVLEDEGGQRVELVEVTRAVFIL